MGNLKFRQLESDGANGEYIQISFGNSLRPLDCGPNNRFQGTLPFCGDALEPIVIDSKEWNETLGSNTSFLL